MKNIINLHVGSTCCRLKKKKTLERHNNAQFVCFLMRWFYAVQIVTRCYSLTVIVLTYETLHFAKPVSYTHLDVYKRQIVNMLRFMS